MSATQLVSTLPTPVLAAALAANLIPYLSALATRRPGWWTGAVTVALSLLGAVLSAVAQSGDQDWRYVAAVTAIMWIVARLHLNTFVKGTQIEAALHSVGNSPPTPADAGYADLILVLLIVLVLIAVFGGLFLHSALWLVLLVVVALLVLAR